MDFRFAHSLFQALSGDHCAVGYSGTFPDEHSARLIELGSEILSGQGLGTGMSGRLGYVMVEAYQNILRHRASLPLPSEGNKDRSLFLLRCHAEGQHVVTINPVDKARAAVLRLSLARLKGRNKTELKSLFLSGLQRESRADARGAGLGLIEMIRRANGDPGWLLQPLDEDHELFALAVRLGKGPPGARVAQSAMDLHGTLAQMNVRLFHAGHLSPGMIGILKRSIEQEAPGSGKCVQALEAVLELFPGRAGGKGSGVLIFAGEASRTSFITGAVVTRERAEMLHDFVQGNDKGQSPPALRKLSRISAAPLAFADLPVKGGRLFLVKAAW